MIASALLHWGSSFANDHVSDELAAQNIRFPDADALTGQGREDLLAFAGQQVATGEHAEVAAGVLMAVLVFAGLAHLRKMAH